MSIGCICELAVGAEHHKHTIVVMEKDNINRHAFVLELADIVFETTKEAREYIHKLIDGEI